MVVAAVVVAAVLAVVVVVAAVSALSFAHQGSFQRRNVHASPEALSAAASLKVVPAHSNNAFSVIYT
ncbi:hypothetical protein E2C01_100923 [Portunus trituberculatus]|uniref:Uncharacterized protein n=1 Tax=Portunus trituberculatus TaxID=210409 RepID=A0A5B7K4D8_PORTR|nr:hypothetical protein [Portunus trituberculatus]